MRKMKFVCLLLATATILACCQGKEEDVGPVIGIDLGTTYSW